MGLLEHRQQVAQLVSAAPSQIPEEMSYLEGVISDKSTVGFFAEHARGPEWLAWAATRVEFQSIFKPDSAACESTPVLAYWFADNYVMDAFLSDQAWALVSGMGAFLGPHLWEAIGRQLSRREPETSRPGRLSRWLVLMARDAPQPAEPWMGYALMETAWPEERAAALLVFDYLTEPRVEVHRPFALAEGSRAEIRLRGDRWALEQAWSRVFKPHLDEAAQDLMAIADHHLRQAHAMLLGTGAAGPGWDPISFSRSAIEPHAQDSIPEPANVLINAARDCLEFLLTSGSPVGAAYTQSWAETDVPLLRRLAIHGWTHRTDVDAAAKLTWLRERGWLFDHELRHEVFALIAATISVAPSVIANAITADAQRGPTSTDHQEYEAYNALIWITRHAPDLENAQTALSQAQSRHPEFAERPHPDLTGWVEVGWVQPRRPMSADELHGLLADDPVSAISRLRSESSISQGLAWEDALSLISETVRDRPLDGLIVLDANVGGQSDLVSTVIRGWSTAQIPDTDAQNIIAALRGIDLSSAYGDVTRMLAGTGQSDSASTKWHRIPAARLLAIDVWEMIPETSGANASIEEWLSRAINHPSGHLAQFWISALADDWRMAGDDWAGLPTAILEQLDIMLAGSGNSTQMAEIIFASQAHFFRSADSGWCLEHILPLLNWEKPARARRTWEGFLAWGKFDELLLAAGLRDQYLETANHILEFPDDYRRQLYLHLSAVSLYAPDAATSDWVRSLTAKVALDVRVGWMERVGWQLAQLPQEAVETYWGAWMRQYWQERLESIPAILTKQEATAMAVWTIYLSLSLENGVSLVTTAPAGISRHSRLLHELADGRMSQASSAAAKLVAHLLQGTNPPFYECHELRKITQNLANQALPEDLTAIREEALRLGCADAPQW